MIYGGKNPSPFLVECYEDIIKDARCKREIQRAEQEPMMLDTLYFVAADVPSDTYITNVLRLHFCEQ